VRYYLKADAVGRPVGILRLKRSALEPVLKKYLEHNPERQLSLVTITSPLELLIEKFKVETKETFISVTHESDKGPKEVQGR
jgi:hypothetical protein